MEMNQEIFISRLKQTMDELYGLMRHAPKLFEEQISKKVASEGDILHCSLEWSFQSDDSHPLRLCIESIHIGEINVKRFDSSWDKWKAEVPNEMEQSR